MPKTIKAAILIYLLKIFTALAMIMAATLTIFYKADAGFWHGFQKSLARSAGAESVETFSAKHAAEFSGELLFYVVVFCVCLWSLKSRRFLPVLLISILLTLSDFREGGFPLLMIVVTVLLLTSSGKEWLCQKSDSAE